MLPGCSEAVPVLSWPDHATEPSAPSAWSAPFAVGTRNGVAEVTTSGVRVAPPRSGFCQPGNGAPALVQRETVLVCSGTRMLPSAATTGPSNGTAVVAIPSGSPLALTRVTNPLVPLFGSASNPLLQANAAETFAPSGRAGDQ